MKTKMNKMNKKSIKFINNIALTLVLFMTVFVACQKEVGIVPDPLPAAKSGVANNKEVTFNPGIYDQAAGDPLFTAYYEATMQLKAPLFDKIMKEGPMEKSDKLLASINAAIENNNLGQVAELMGYESLECYNATIENVKSAASKLIQKYPSLATENSGAMEKTSGIFFEKYQSNSASPFLRVAIATVDLGPCGSGCKKPRIPDQECCDKAAENYNTDIFQCAGAALAGLAGCLLAGPFYPACALAVIAAEVVCMKVALNRVRTERKYCCKDKPGELDPDELESDELEPDDLGPE